MFQGLSNNLYGTSSRNEPLQHNSYDGHHGKVYNQSRRPHSDTYNNHYTAGQRAWGQDMGSPYKGGGDRNNYYGQNRHSLLTGKTHGDEKTTEL